METYFQAIARNLSIKAQQVSATAELLNGGATVPFIARYRKETTGMLDEVGITAIRDQLEAMKELDKRREAILKSLEERQLLSEELKTSLKGAQNLTSLEDIYLPFRPKRKTRAVMAAERGLGPLAKIILGEDRSPLRPEQFINPEKGVNNAEEALAGARDIIAEQINEDPVTRETLRALFLERGIITSSLIKKKEADGAKFKDYFDWHEPAAKAPGHRILAILRGENEKILSVNIRPDEKECIRHLTARHIKRNTPHPEQLRLAVTDAYKRLLGPSLENDLRKSLKTRADHEAIGVFCDNVRSLLLAPPLGRKRIMALDPGFRTGAKLVCLDGQGKLLHYATIYPTHGEKQQREAGANISELCRKFAIEAIAVGNGTAGRETESFVRSLGLDPSIIITMVDESGASIYSASEIARREFPDHDVTVRGAVSIGRRLQDPLAELVKLDPKSIGVGQYQHDVDQGALKKGLDDVVMSCVNSVGVEINTASLELLTRVSGLGTALAQNILTYRDENGPFTNRRQLLKVPRLGAKAFEQCAGFLRIRDGENPLDASGVHPESYPVISRMAADLNCSTADLITDGELRKKIEPSRYVSDGLGMVTLHDILAELEKPGRDPRPSFNAFSFDQSVNKIEDLNVGMRLPGIVTNVTKFGAFVDIGVHQDGLIHISQLADRFVKDPSEVIAVRQQVIVRVLEVDKERKRIALSLRSQS
ncbi:MAG: RNA-binding transcriptional accessory protein [Desulfobulbaceae bacterium]|nr:RNA-binding transcriptional accessory protein [Desulfobulbaceae bacterium]